MTLPVFYINLSEDKDKRCATEHTLASLFTNVARIPGVLHPNGKEGCRQAHIRANQAGVYATVPGEYYLIVEDDVQLNMAPCQAQDAMQTASSTGADLILLNAQNQPETVQLKGGRTSIYAHPFRFHHLLAGAYSGLAYMVRHEFGRRLVRHWQHRIHQNRHIDITWQSLWPTHNVLLIQPLVFLHRPGRSRTGDTSYRHATDTNIQDFDWSKLRVSQRSAHAAT